MQRVVPFFSCQPHARNLGMYAGTGLFLFYLPVRIVSLEKLNRFGDLSNVNPYIFFRRGEERLVAFFNS